MSKITLVPTLFSTSFEEMIEQYLNINKYSNFYFSYFHIDIMRDDFVSSTNYDAQKLEKLCSLLHKNEHRAEVHLMVKHPLEFIEEIIRINSIYNNCISSIIIHYESFDSKEELEFVVEQVTSNYSSISFQLAINPNTTVEDIITLLSSFSNIMVMGVVPGKQRQNFIENRLSVIMLLLKLGVNVSIDGGLNEKTISQILLKISPLLVQSQLQFNIGSYLNNIHTSKKEFNTKLTTLQHQIKNHLHLSNLTHQEQLSKNPYIVLIDVGGTHTKIYIGSFEEFSVKHIQVIQTSSIKTFGTKHPQELFTSIIKKIGIHSKIDFLILGVAGEKHDSTILMTHQELEFDMKFIKEQFPQFKEVFLYNDCELAGYGVQSSQEYLDNTVQKYKRTHNNLSHIQNNTSLDSHFLELLIIIGTGVGIAHISNQGISYNSQGGHIITQLDDILYLEYLRSNLEKNTISFDDIISARGLEARYQYDTGEYKSTYEICKLAFKKDVRVTKTIEFYLQELYYFLLDCMYFDNIVTNIYLGGEFSYKMVELFKLYKPKEFQELQQKCTIICISNDYLQFSGALQIIYSKIFEN
ncbi:MAG: hypothetical protein ACMXYB_01745 [Candidatus Woesearchaeota archaeon]